MRDGERETGRGDRDYGRGRPPKGQKPCERCWEVESRGGRSKNGRAQRSRYWRDLAGRALSTRRGRRTARISPRPQGAIPPTPAPPLGVALPIPAPPPRRDATRAHPQPEREAPKPVRARLLLPRRGLYRDSKRCALRTLPRRLHRQRLALRRCQRGASATTAPTIPQRVTPQLPTAPTNSSSAGGALPESPLISRGAGTDDLPTAGGHPPLPPPSPPGTPIPMTSSVAGDVRPDDSPTAGSGPPQRPPSPPGAADPSHPFTTGWLPPRQPPHRRARTPQRPLPASSGDTRPQNVFPRP